jgi:tetratricopeptide (TPR) repeat protein
MRNRLGTRYSQSGIMSGVLCGIWLAAACPVANTLAETSAPSTSREGGFSLMLEMSQGRLWDELIAKFKDEDLSAWDRSAADAFSLRGQAYDNVKEYAKAEKDLKSAIALAPDNGYYWCALADVYHYHLKDDQKALEAYNKAYELDKSAHTAKSFGWMPINATLEAAGILFHQLRYDEALIVLGRYDEGDIAKMAPSWASRMLRTYAQIYLGQGKERAALTVLQRALELDGK